MKAKDPYSIVQATFPSWEFLNYYYDAVNGRVWLLWDSNVLKATLLQSAGQFLHVKVHHLLGKWECQATVVDAENDGIFRRHKWWTWGSKVRPLSSIWRL